MLPTRKYLPIILLSSITLMACENKSTPTTNQEEAKTTSMPATQAPAEEATLVAGCDSCHGEAGMATYPEMPFIAGQNAAYLETALHSYLIGDRKHNPMRLAVFDLEEADRKKLAEHYAQLNTPWKEQPTRVAADTSEADKQRDIRAGKALSRPCTSCHGADGNSVKEGVPSLAGLQPEYFIPALKSYLNGERKGAAIMKNFKLSLRDRQIRQLAAYFAAQKRQRSPLGPRLKASEASSKFVQSCVGCHGENGNSSHPAMPSLAGQNAAYLETAMKKYRDKKRGNPMMVNAAQGLSDKAIRSAAVFFATRTPITVAKQTTAAGSAAFNPMGDGEKLAASCNGCHGAKGNSQTAGTPRLAGLAQAYLQSAISQYRDGKRKHDMMKLFTQYLSDTDIEKLALYYASQTPASRTNKPAKAGAEFASSCAGCHGEDGNSETPTTPSLAGQDAKYIIAALKAYKNEGRANADMKGAAEELDNKAMQQLGDYYSKLEPKASPVRQMEASQALAEKCNRCHGDDGKNPTPDKPRIAGQRQTYLINSLLAYKSKERLHSMMHNMTADLSLVEIETISAYYANK